MRKEGSKRASMCTFSLSFLDQMQPDHQSYASVINCKLIDFSHIGLESINLCHGTLGSKAKKKCHNVINHSLNNSGLVKLQNMPRSKNLIVMDDELLSVCRKIRSVLGSKIQITSRTLIEITISDSRFPIPSFWQGPFGSWDHPFAHKSELLLL